MTNTTDDEAVKDNARELIETSLPAMSTELLTAFDIVLNPHTFVKDTGIREILYEELERRRNAA